MDVCIKITYLEAPILQDLFDGDDLVRLGDLRQKDGTKGSVADHALCIVRECFRIYGLRATDEGNGGGKCHVLVAVSGMC